MNVLQLGIPKGSLEEATIELFRRSGWKIKTDARSYFPSIDDPGLRCLLVRAQEMARYVASGTLDAGITGRDWVLEDEADVVVAQELVYSKTSLRPTRWVLVVGGDSPVRKPEDLRGKRIATELVGYTRRWFAERNVDVHIEFSWGATEAKVAEGLVDAIVEVTETGSTIRARADRAPPGRRPPRRGAGGAQDERAARPPAGRDRAGARDHGADRVAALRNGVVRGRERDRRGDGARAHPEAAARRGGGDHRVSVEQDRGVSGGTVAGDRIVERYTGGRRSVTPRMRG